MRKITNSGAVRRQMRVVIGATLALSAVGVVEAAASTKAYQINGRWYSPHGASGYDRTGTASWYGPGFHGRKTANGETYDQWGWTAAHPTLPMGTQVYVTNQKSGKTVKVRINDRGPFAGGRIIDLSRSVAESLGIKDNGVGQVRVRHAGLGAPSDDRRVIAKKKDEDKDNQKPKVAEKPKAAPEKAKVAAAESEAKPKPKTQPAASQKASSQPAPRPAPATRPLREKEPERHETLIMPGLAAAFGKEDTFSLPLATRQIELQAVAEVRAEWRRAMASGRKS
jgi:rare lipoprotein A (peptidoglycan hydrolase)